jgi:hypothetical protein
VRAAIQRLWQSSKPTNQTEYFPSLVSCAFLGERSSDQRAFFGDDIMIRSVSLATVFVAALAIPAMAEEKNKIDPAGGTGPTSTMTDQVPQMKKDAAGQSDSKSSPGAPAAAIPAQGATLSLTEQEAKSWIDKPVYSSDGKKVGEVAAFQRSGDNSVTEMHADIGGFLGIGETRVRLTPAQFKLQGDRVLIDLTAAQAKDLPTVQK